MSEHIHREDAASAKPATGIQAEVPAAFRRQPADSLGPALSLRKSGGRSGRWLVMALGAVLLLACGLWLLSTQTLWVGSTNVALELLVVDADTQQPIPKAQVLVVRDERWDSPETLSTGGDGVLTIVKRCTSSGQSGPFKNTRSVSVHPWSFRVEAPGYAASDPIGAADYHSQIQDRGSYFALPLRVELRRSDD